MHVDVLTEKAKERDDLRFYREIHKKITIETCEERVGAIADVAVWKKGEKLFYVLHAKARKKHLLAFN